MTRTLYLVRHAKSGWDDPTLADFDRPLSRRGEREAADLRALFTEAGYAPELIVCSTARRTRETLAALLGALSHETRIVLTRAIYEAPTTRLLDQLHRTDAEIASLALVGHNPGLEELTHLLAGSGETEALRAFARKYPPAGVAVIDFAEGTWAGIAAGTGHLRAFHVPADQ